MNIYTVQPWLMKAGGKNIAQNGCERNTVMTSICKIVRESIAMFSRVGIRNNVTRYAQPCAMPSNRIRKGKANTMTYLEQLKRKCYLYKHNKV